MTISVSVFKARCLELLHRVEEVGEPLLITRRGRVIARVLPGPAGAESADQLARPPWERLRGLGRLLAVADESVLADQDFHAMR